MTRPEFRRYLEESGVMGGLDEMLVGLCNHTNMGEERKRESD